MATRTKDKYYIYIYSSLLIQRWFYAELKNKNNLLQKHFVPAKNCNVLVWALKPHFLCKPYNTSCTASFLYNVAQPSFLQLTHLKYTHFSFSITQFDLCKAASHQIMYMGVRNQVKNVQREGCKLIWLYLLHLQRIVTCRNASVTVILIPLISVFFFSGVSSDLFILAQSITNIRCLSIDAASFMAQQCFSHLICNLVSTRGIAWREVDPLTV